jgi:uncharacterized protein (DUF1330 family)
MSAYFVLHNRIRDAEKMREYIPKAIASMAPYKPEILIFDENSEMLEGNADLPRTIVIRFDSRADAMAWYRSPEYLAILPLRMEATEGFAVLAEGFVPGVGDRSSV